MLSRDQIGAYCLWSRKNSRRPRQTWDFIGVMVHHSPTDARRLVREAVLHNLAMSRHNRIIRKQERERELERRARERIRKPKAWYEANKRWPYPKLRRAYMLRLRKGGMIYREIGEIMGLSVERSRQLVKRAEVDAELHEEKILGQMNMQLRMDRNYLDIGRPLPKWREGF